MIKPEMRKDSFAVFSQKDSCIIFNIGTLCIVVNAVPVKGRKYTINVSRMNEEMDEDVIISFEFLLSKEEFDALCFFSLLNPLFVDSIEILVAKRVAGDILSFFLMSLGNNDGVAEMGKRYKKEWEDYTKYLINERRSQLIKAEYCVRNAPSNNSDIND